MKLVVDIPDETMAAGLFEDAAAVAGWVAQIPDEHGVMQPNPVSAVAACFYHLVIPMLAQHAIHQRVEREMVAVRMQAKDDVMAATTIWQTAMQGGG